MITKSFTSRELDRKIKSIANLLPHDLNKLDVYYIDKEIIFVVTNKEGIDVTNDLRNIQIPDHQDIFELFYDTFFFVSDKTCNYSYRFNYNKISENILNGSYFKQVRIKYKKTLIEPITNIANWLGLDHVAIYAIEANEKSNCRVDFLLKYSLFFKKPIFMFLNQKYAKEILSNMTAELEREGVIDNITANKVKKYYFKDI